MELCPRRPELPPAKALHSLPDAPNFWRVLLPAIIVPIAFTVCFLFVYPAVPSERTDDFTAWPSVCLTLIGFAAWIFIVRAVIRAFRAAASRLVPSIAASLAFAFLLVLLLAAWAISVRPL